MKGKKKQKQKISMQWSAKTQIAWERAADAVWEGYLIDNITPLFPLVQIPVVWPVSSSVIHIYKHTDRHINDHALCICPVTILPLHVTPPTNLNYECFSMLF